MWKHQYLKNSILYNKCSYTVTTEVLTNRNVLCETVSHETWYQSVEHRNTVYLLSVGI